MTQLMAINGVGTIHVIRWGDLDPIGLARPPDLTPPGWQMAQLTPSDEALWGPGVLKYSLNEGL
mgnify:CR=1 FL=1